MQKRNETHQNVKAPPIIWMLFFNIMVMWIIFFLIPVQIPFYLKSIGVEKNSLIGAAIAMSTLFSAMSSFSYSKIKARLSFLSIFSMGYLLMAAGFLCIAFSTYLYVSCCCYDVMRLGMGMMIPNTNMWVMKIAPPEIRGKEIGKLTTFWFLGQFLSPIIIVPILKSLSLSSTFMMAAGFLFLLSLVSCFFILVRWENWLFNKNCWMIVLGLLNNQIYLVVRLLSHSFPQKSLLFSLHQTCVTQV